MFSCAWSRVAHRLCRMQNMTAHTHCHSYVHHDWCVKVCSTSQWPWPANGVMRKFRPSRCVREVQTKPRLCGWEPELVKWPQSHPLSDWAYIHTQSISKKKYERMAYTQARTHTHTPPGRKTWRWYCHWCPPVCVKHGKHSVARMNTNWRSRRVLQTLKHD